MLKKKTAVKFFIILVMVFLAVEGVGYYIASHDASGKNTNMKKAGKLNGLKAKNAVLKDRIRETSLKGLYIVIDTGENILFLRDGEKTIRKAVISSGSGSILKDPEGKRQWVFDTPRGEYAVKSKAVNPNWIKPDWAFIEEGENIPRRFKDRVEEGVLGDYALGFGNGYFIHGTLYTRLLGRNVTHGCIRVGDDDLNALYKASQIGTRILIF